LDIAVTDEGMTRTFALVGELDLTTVEQVEEAVGSPQPGARCLIDLRGLRFMDSCGVRMFLRLGNRAREGGWTIALVHGGGMIGRVLDLCRLEERMEVMAA
jgi:anti-anti-sigma factor